MSRANSAVQSLLLHKSGIGLFGRGTTVEYAWIHDAHYFSGLHSSMIANRANDVVIRRVNLDGGATAPLWHYQPLNNILVEESVFNVDGSSYCAGFGSNHPTSNVRVIGNKWGQKYFPNCGGFGPVVFWSSAIVPRQWTNNSWFVSGAPFPEPGT